MLRDSAAMLKELIDDLLDHAQIEAGMMAMSSAVFNPAVVIEEAMSILGAKVEEKGLGMHAHFGALPWLMGDALRVRQIVLNLLANAVKFTERGWIRLEAWSKPEAQGMRCLHIAVSDTGIGIAPEQQARIFNRFAQADASIGLRYGGSGLGLSICRQLARMMQGDITVESAQGEGSRFTATLRLPEAVMSEALAA